MNDKEKLSLAIEALDRIGYPIRYFQQEAEKEGKVIDGLMAVMISQDHSYLQGVAQKALKELLES